MVEEAHKLEDSCEFVARESKINVSARVVNTRSGAKDKDNESIDDQNEIESSEIDKERIVELQHLDVNIKVVLDLKEKGVKPDQSDISKYSPEVKYNWNHWDSLYVKNNILFRNFENESSKETIWQIVLPKALRKFVLKQVHDSVTGGHLGITKTLSKVTSRFFWHKMRKDVEVWCKTCDLCASRNMPQKKPKASMKQYNVGAPLETVAVDIMGPIPRTQNGNKYITVVGDYFSKWMQAFAIRQLDAVTVARKLVDQFVTIMGVPLQIHSDQGANFESDLFKGMCKILGIEKTRTTAMRPQSDGMVERANRTIQNMLSAFVAEHQNDWDEYLPLLMMAYRSAVHESTGYSTCKMIFGREINLPLDLVIGKPEIENENITNHSTYAQDVENNIDVIHDFAREKLNLSSDRMKKCYDKNLSHTNFNVGDAVWYYNPQRKVGICPKYKDPGKDPLQSQRN